MSCHCLCTVNHPDQPAICTGEGVAPLRFSKFPEESELNKLGFDHVDVQMCNPCRTETLTRKKETANG